MSIELTPKILQRADYTANPYKLQKIMKNNQEYKKAIGTII
jgi:hypothetical protein